MVKASQLTWHRGCEPSLPLADLSTAASSSWPMVAGRGLIGLQLPCSWLCGSQSGEVGRVVDKPELCRKGGDDCMMRGDDGDCENQADGLAMVEEMALKFPAVIVWLCLESKMV